MVQPVQRLKIHSKKERKKGKRLADFIERPIVKIRTSSFVFSPSFFGFLFSFAFSARTLAGLERGRKPPEPESLFIEGDKHFYGPLANYYFLQPPLLDLCRQHPSSTISLTFLLLFFHFCTFIFFSSHILFSFSGDESFSFSLFGEDKLKRKEISLNGTMEFQNCSSMDGYCSEVVRDSPCICKW